MQKTSRHISSNQPDCHPDLESTVEKHIRHEFQRPILSHNKKAFAVADDIYQQHSDNFILDSGCGVGESTYHIAKNNPDAFVLGIDQSEHRLALNNDWHLPSNALLLRADLIDFWRLAVASNWKLTEHYLLYPNPWPKKKHLARRWHGHPVFPAVLKLGGRLELRSNWAIYVEEFSRAVNKSLALKTEIEQWNPESFITPFERKYAAGDQGLFRLVVDLNL